MKYDPKRRRSESIRLKGYDYSQPGAYFVTICSHNRIPIFGRVVDGEMHLNEYGKIVDEFWGNVALHFPNVAIDVSVVMPNHVHAVIVIKDAGEETSPLQKNRQSRHSVSHQSYQRIKKATTLIGKAFWREMETNWKSTTAIFLNPLQQQAECWE